MTTKLQQAVADLRECDGHGMEFAPATIFTGGGREDECFELLARLIELADQDAVVRRRWSELGKPAAIDDLRFVGVLSGKSGAYRVDVEVILTKAAEALRRRQRPVPQNKHTMR